MERIYDDALNEEIYINSYSNGLKAFVIKKKNFSKAFAGFATKYGSVDSKFVHPKTKEVVEVPDGIAHFLEHKLFEEEEGNVFDRFAKFGAMANAFTSFKETVYYFISTQNFYENFEILLDFVQNPYFTDQNVEKEKGIIGQEIRMYQDNPNWRVYFNLLNALYVNNPVKIDIAGTLESIQKITKEDLYLCYNTFYHPSNMIIVVCGDVDPKKVFDTIERMEKTKEYQSLIERIYPDEPEKLNQKKIEARLSVAVPIFYIGFKDNQNDLPPYEMIMKDIQTQIMAEMLFGKSTDFYEKLYKEGLINQNFGFEYNCEPEYSFFMIGGESKDPEEVYRRIIEHIEDVKKKGIDREEFERAKKVVLGTHLRKFDNPEKLSVEFIYNYFKGVNIFEYVKQISSVSFEMCEKRLKEFFDESTSCISIVWPTN
ncbi:EF-P 5-aminopentanol modification-associated protein YfmH [Anaerocellum diazotrophicum]|uniref:Peptidase M16 n=1 Tax=Caldicellulosiruptor diazotrophicus TaxID=2806205 RepID=A0ABN6E8C5_9FIRM|nr:pitrilysin family protein [Caldicellulosiruptor diazotrophicus]BCS81745.1 peptidase M16 [Caldicellulosiruptor diazotrophicus]